MYTVSKRRYIASLIIIFILGGLLSYGALFLSGGRILSAAQYKEYHELKSNYGRLSEMQGFLEENYYLPVENDDIATGLYRGLFSAANDPFTHYYTEEEYKDAIAESSSQLSGIGVVLQLNELDDVEIQEVIKQTPAYFAGIKEGDIILMIDDEAVSASNITETAHKLRGDSGTKVKVSVLRDNEEIDFDIKRENFKIDSISSEIIEGNVGYIKIDSFLEGTSSDFKESLEMMEAEAVNGLIIDLRNNPGGLVEEGLLIADMLMDEAVVAYTEDRQGVKEEYTTEDGRTDLNYMILINENTASTAEIVAAGVKESQSGVLVGKTSLGKGIIQNLHRFDEGDGCRITVMQYFTASGKQVHKKGISPDYEVEEIDDLTNLFKYFS